MLKKIIIIIIVLCFFGSCVPNNKEKPEKNKQVEVELFFKSGNHDIFVYDISGELKIKKNNLIDFDSSYCGCSEQEPLASNVEAFKIIRTTNITTGEVIEKNPINENKTTSDSTLIKKIQIENLLK